MINPIEDPPEFKNTTTPPNGLSEELFAVFSLIVGLLTIVATVVHPWLLALGCAEMVIIKLAWWYYYDRTRQLVWAGMYLAALVSLWYIMTIADSATVTAF